MAKGTQDISRDDLRKQNAVLDALNVKLLEELGREPRLTMAGLARRVGMSAPAVTERVQRLERLGVIAGYRLEVDPSALGYPLAAFVRIRPTPGQLPRIVDVVKATRQVVECHRITGEDCLLLKVWVADVQRLEELLDRFTMYGQTTTSIVQSSPVPPRPLPLD